MAERAGVGAGLGEDEVDVTLGHANRGRGEGRKRRGEHSQAAPAEVAPARMAPTRRNAHPFRLKQDPFWRLDAAAETRRDLQSKYR
jgi:hypothetical protein